MRQIGKYTVDDNPIGSGGMGQVLRGWMPDGRPVAIKEILPEFVSDVEFRFRINQEVKFLVMLNQKLNGHRGVVKVYDSFELNGHLYIVMELVEGRDIEHIITASGRMPFAQAMRYMLRILDTMQLVHEQQVVHRDIKPGNIMVRPDEEICILDFGVAKNADSSTQSHTVIGSIIGTDGYMSPEQANGMSIDHRSDIYSLACVLFYMLTGQHAYQKTGNDVQMMIDIVNKPFPRLDKYVSGLPSGIQDVMDKASDKNMMKRYQSCREFRMDLMRVAGIGTRIDPPVATNEIGVSIGRENCDICAGTDNYKVSRHHADVTFKVFTGGRYYVYTDCSSNGTTIDGTPLRKGMSYNIPEGTHPVIWLANDPSSSLDWAEVLREIQSRMPREVQPAKPEPKSEPSHKESSGFLHKIRSLFSHK